MENGYNGWTNKATWATFTWLTDEYNIYLKILQDKHGIQGMKNEELHNYLIGIFGGYETPDGDDLSTVNFDEIRVAIRELS